MVGTKKVRETQVVSRTAVISTWKKVAAIIRKIKTAAKKQKLIRSDIEIVEESESIQVYERVKRFGRGGRYMKGTVLGTVQSDGPYRVTWTYEV